MPFILFIEIKMKIKSIIVVVLLFFFYWLVIPYICGSIWGVISIWYYLMDIIVTLSYVTFYVISLLLLFFLYKKTEVDFAFQSSNNDSEKMSFFKLFLVAVFFQSITIIYKFLSNQISNTQEIECQIDSVFIVRIIVALVLAPIVEELFYRKWMISYLEKSKVKPYFVLFMTSILFFIAHTNYVNWTFQLDAFFFGIMQYFIYKKSFDVRYCIWVHFINNIIATSTNIAFHYF